MTEQDLVQIATWLFLYVIGFGAVIAFVHWWDGRKGGNHDTW